MSKRCCAKSCYNSQLITKNIHYFGFPKHAEFARQWALAAGREDLLEKPIHNIIKYFLCSSHFTDDCFLDAPTNSKLKKTLRPIHVPIPTIFVSNIKEFLPKDDECSPNECFEYIPNIQEIKDGAEMLASNDNCSRQHDQVTYLEEYVTPSSSPPRKMVKLEKKPDEIVRTFEDEISQTQLSDIDSDEPNLSGDEIDEVHKPKMDADVFPYSAEVYNSTKDGQDENMNIEENEVDEIYGISSEDEQNHQLEQQETLHDILTCRLCANEYFVGNLLFFEDDTELIDTINSVLNRSVIRSDDYLPQQICVPCLDKVQQCRYIIDSFEMVQESML